MQQLIEQKRWSSSAILLSRTSGDFRAWKGTECEFDVLISIVGTNMREDAMNA